MSELSLTYRKLSDNFANLARLVEAGEMGKSPPDSPSVAPNPETLPETPSEPESPVVPQAAPEEKPVNQWLPIRQQLAAANQEIEKLPADDPHVKNIHARLNEIENLLNGVSSPAQLLAGIQNQISQALDSVAELFDKFDAAALQSHLHQIDVLVGTKHEDVIEGGTDVAGDITG